MKKSRFTEEQIHTIIKESEVGVKTSELCRKYGISQNTFYNWRSKYGGMELSDMKRLKELEGENSRLKHLVAEQALDILALKEVLEKKY
jgi:putative transposase